MKQPAHLALQPFGQIPTYEDGNVTLFETGAIVLHIAERNPGLLPANEAPRCRAIAWMFAAKSTVEPAVIEREAAVLLERDKPWFEQRMPILDQRVGTRLDQLSAALGDSDWLDGEFSAGDLLMINVFRRPAASALLDDYPNLVSYVSRGEARPAFKRAFADQLAVFTAASA
jgi:glutathione S-transferase